MNGLLIEDVFPFNLDQPSVEERNYVCLRRTFLEQNSLQSGKYFLWNSSDIASFCSQQRRCQALFFYEIAQTPLNLRQKFLNHTPSQGNSFQSPGFGGECNSRPVNIGKSLAKGGQLGPNQRKDTYQNSFDHPLLKFRSLSRCVHIKE